jgi:hypothetical protein
MIIGWGSLMIIELVFIAALGAPYLSRIEPLLFRLSSDRPFDFLNAISGLDLQAIGLYFGV